MKRFKKILSFILLLLITISLVGCFDSGNNDFNGSDNNTEDKNPGGGSGIVITSFRVNFYIDNELKYYTITNNMEVFTPPEIPEKKNFKVIGWFYADGTKADFSKPHKKQTDFYAKYEADYAALINEVTANVISANVKITNTSYNKGFLGIKKDQVSITGSGIIFHDQHGYYYLLTNAHVTRKIENRSYADYTITDYKGNNYTGNLQKDSEQPKYDLSTLYFKKSNQKLNVIKRANKNPILSEEVIAIGQPDGQNNAITFGTVTDYRKVTTTDGFTTFFNSMIHSAPTYGGSSGGAILDFNFNLVGVHFAGSRDAIGNFIQGVAIPIETIIEYLNKYVYN